MRHLQALGLPVELRQDHPVLREIRRRPPDGRRCRCRCQGCRLDRGAEQLQGALCADPWRRDLTRGSGQAGGVRDANLGTQLGGGAGRQPRNALYRPWRPRANLVDGLCGGRSVAANLAGYAPGQVEYGFGIEKRAGAHVFQLTFANTFGRRSGNSPAAVRRRPCISASTSRESFFLTCVSALADRTPPSGGQGETPMSRLPILAVAITLLATGCSKARTTLQRLPRHRRPDSSSRRRCPPVMKCRRLRAPNRVLPVKRPSP